MYGLSSDLYTETGASAIPSKDKHNYFLIPVVYQRIAPEQPLAILYMFR